MVSEIPLSEFGLMTVDAAAAARGCGVRAVQNWINEGLLPAVRAGSGQRCVFLLRAKDVKEFIPPPRGRPAKANADEAPAKKPAGKRAKRGKGR